MSAVPEEIQTVQTESPFESKEHYLAFRKAWSESVNSPEAKKTLEVSVYGDPYWEPGCMNSGHFVLYAVLRGRDWRKGFTTPIKESKKNNNSAYFAGTLVKRYREINDQYTETSEHLVGRMEIFLKPFKGTVTIEMLLASSDRIDLD